MSGKKSDFLERDAWREIANDLLEANASLEGLKSVTFVKGDEQLGNFFLAELDLAFSSLFTRISRLRRDAYEREVVAANDDEAAEARRVTQ